MVLSNDELGSGLPGLTTLPFLSAGQPISTALTVRACRTRRTRPEPVKVEIRASRLSQTDVVFTFTALNTGLAIALPPPRSDQHGVDVICTVMLCDDAQQPMR
jgi:hypothetical protein